MAPDGNTMNSSKKEDVVQILVKYFTDQIYICLSKISKCMLRKSIFQTKEVGEFRTSQMIHDIKSTTTVAKLHPVLFSH
jgi:hypothetical protein